MTGFTLDGYALTGLFVVMFGFLAFSAWVFERAEPDPISGDRRHQAHPFDASTEGFSIGVSSPRSRLERMEPSVDVPRGSSTSVVPD